MGAGTGPLEIQWRQVEILENLFEGSFASTSCILNPDAVPAVVSDHCRCLVVSTAPVQ